MTFKKGGDKIMQISEELVKQITNAVLSQMSQSGVSSSEGDRLSLIHI